MVLTNVGKDYLDRRAREVGMPVQEVIRIRERILRDELHVRTRLVPLVRGERFALHVIYAGHSRLVENEEEFDRFIEGFGRVI